MFLKNFPLHTSPFWNVPLYPDGLHAKKVDVILSGQETIGSAERSSNKDDMRSMFYSISDSQYSRTLFAKFTKPRVEHELEEFLSYDFPTRSGGGIGVTRLIRSLKMEGLLDEIMKEYYGEEDEDEDGSGICKVIDFSLKL